MLSVVIPAYNEAQNIAQCLEALTHQDTSEPFEVILVDNNCTDHTVQVAKQFASKLNLRILPEPKQGRGQARFAGFAAATGEIIFSTDADTQVHPQWISRTLPFFSDPKIIAVTGECYINDCNWYTNLIFNFITALTVPMYRLLFGYYPLNGFNFAIRKSVYNRSERFDPKINGVEDVDLAHKVHHLGKIGYVKNNRVLFSGRRFKNNLISGLWPYLKMGWLYHHHQVDKISLEDVR